MSVSISWAVIAGAALIAGARLVAAGLTRRTEPDAPPGTVDLGPVLAKLDRVIGLLPPMGSTELAIQRGLEGVDATTTAILERLTGPPGAPEAGDDAVAEALLVAIREAQDAALYRLIRAHRTVDADSRDLQHPIHQRRDWAYIRELLGPKPTA